MSNNTVNEIWKDIPGYEGAYMASTLGRISNSRRILSGCVPHYSKYRRYSLSKSKKSKTWYAHQLIAVTFIGDKPGGMEVRHLDGNADNNSLSNITYGTRKENIDDRTKHNPIRKGWKKLSSDSVLHIKAQKGITTVHELSKIHEISMNQIFMIWAGKAHKNII